MQKSFYFWALRLFVALNGQQLTPLVLSAGCGFEMRSRLKLPAWAAGLPLGGKVYSGPHYLAPLKQAAAPLVAPDPNARDVERAIDSYIDATRQDAGPIDNPAQVERDDDGGFVAEASTASLSQAEIIAIIKALSDADKITLMKIARLYARRTAFDHDDLLQEAICRVLSGRRVWARDVPVRPFLAGVMRSIAWEWKSEPHEPFVDPPDPGGGEFPVMAGIVMKNILATFSDDLVAQKIVLLMTQGARGEELQRSSGLGKVEYESKRKKIRRRIEKLLADE